MTRINLVFSRLSLTARHRAPRIYGATYAVGKTTRPAVIFTLAVQRLEPCTFVVWNKPKTRCGK